MANDLQMMAIQLKAQRESALMQVPAALLVGLAGGSALALSGRLAENAAGFIALTAGVGAILYVVGSLRQMLRLRQMRKLAGE